MMPQGKYFLYEFAKQTLETVYKYGKIEDKLTKGSSR